MQENPGVSPTEIANLLEVDWRNMQEEEQAPYFQEAKKVCVCDICLLQAVAHVCASCGFKKD